MVGAAPGEPAGNGTCCFSCPAHFVIAARFVLTSIPYIPDKIFHATDEAVCAVNRSLGFILCRACIQAVLVSMPEPTYMIK